MKGKSVFVVATYTIETGLHRNIVDIFTNEDDAKSYVESQEKLCKADGIAIGYFATILK